MNWFALSITFGIVWWLVLFMVLPFGAAPPDHVEPGTSPGAPARPRIGLKLLVTTAIALVLTALVHGVIQSGWIELEPLRDRPSPAEVGGSRG